MQTKQLGLILLIALLAISLVTASLPYTTSQFINQTTDLNETNYFNGNFDGQVLFIDGNIISAKDINSSGGSSTDTNFETAGYTAAQILLDTNAQTACGDAEVLFGNGSCGVVSSGFTDSNLFSIGFFDVDSNALLIDFNGGQKSLFNFLDGNFTGNVFIDGNLILNGVIKQSTCPSGYVLVPGNNDFGTNDFCVMKYEAQVSSIKQAVSVQGGSPWTDVSWYDAREACKRSGAHLITNAEWMTVARDIEQQASNWQSGVVGTGCLFGGHMDNLPASKLATSDDGNPYSGTNSSDETTMTCPFVSGSDNKKASRRTMNLSNGSVVWDLSGNVWEWVDEQCTNGSGYSSTYWYNSSAWVEWNNGSLSDYEKYVAGPLDSYTSSNGTGQYYGCTANGNALLRGAHWGSGVGAGVFAMLFNNPASRSSNGLGFRCVR